MRTSLLLVVLFHVVFVSCLAFKLEYSQDTAADQPVLSETKTQKETVLAPTQPISSVATPSEKQLPVNGPQKQSAKSAMPEVDLTFQATVDTDLLPDLDAATSIAIKELSSVPPLFAMKTETDKDFPWVDFVITWYNGNDEATQRVREDALNSVRGDAFVANDALFPGRYCDNDELKFTLRSMEMYASWSHKVILVVGDNQPLPEWLNTNAPKLRIVRHSEFFPSDSKLPTFNSLAIESCLHRIEGLSDHFVYFNDDSFLGDYVHPTTFFTEWGRTRVWLSDYKDSAPLSRKDGGHAAAEKNTHRLVRYLTRYTSRDADALNRHLHHQCKALTKMMLGRAEDIVPRQFVKLRNAQFRKLNTISAISFASHMCIHRGECENAPIPNYIFSNLPDEGVEKTFQRIRSQKPTLMCINNGTPELKWEMIAQMESLFPTRSQFEK